MNQPNPQSQATRPDPLIDEVRAIREALSARFHHDLAALGEHLRTVENTHPGPIVRSVEEMPPPPEVPCAPETGERPDPLLDELRAIRRSRAVSRSQG